MKHLDAVWKSESTSLFPILLVAKLYSRSTAKEYNWKRASTGTTLSRELMATVELIFPMSVERPP